MSHSVLIVGLSIIPIYANATYNAHDKENMSVNEHKYRKYISTKKYKKFASKTIKAL